MRLSIAKKNQLKYILEYSPKLPVNAITNKEVNNFHKLCQYICFYKVTYISYKYVKK